MTASSAPCTAPHRHRASPCAFRWCLFGIFVVGVVFLLSTSSDACELPPPFGAMEPVGETKKYYEVGEKVQYKCKRGYEYLLPFLMVATCEANHTWLPINDEGCIRTRCKLLQNPPFGQAHYPDGGFAWGHRVQFTCFEGYYLTSKGVLNCELKGDDAFWNGEPPRCEKVFCSPPPKIKNGKHTLSNIKVFGYRDAVTYSCDPAPGPDNFSLVGSKKIHCSGVNEWSSPPPECKVVECPPPAIKNGKQISGFAEKYSYEAKVMFECIKGFYFNGSDTAVCGGNNTWEPEMPLCLKGPKPTHPTKPPVYNYPGYPNPREGLFDEELDTWLLILIIIIAVVGVIVVWLLLYRCFEPKKKGKTVVSAQQSILLKKPSTTTQQAP